MEPDEANVPVCASVLCVHARLCVCCASLIVCGTNRMNSEDTETVKRRMVAEVLNGIRSGGSGDGLYMAPGVNVRARVELADVDRRGDDYIVVRIEAAGAGGSASIGEKAMVLPAQFRRRYPETSQPPVAGDIVYGAAGYDDFVGPKHRCHYRLVVLVVCQDLELQAWDVTVVRPRESRTSRRVLFRTLSPTFTCRALWLQSSSSTLATYLPRLAATRR